MVSPKVSLKVSCLYVHCVVCNRRRRHFARNRRLACGCSRGRQREKPYVFCLRPSELSAQVRQHNSYTSYSQEYVEGVPMAPRPIFFVVHGGRRSRCLLIGPIGAKACLSRSNANSFTPQEAPELAKMQAKSYVGVG